MIEPLWTDGKATLYHGDCLSVLREFPSESVNCCVTSPPYWGLRDYGVSGQIGLEPTPEAYVAKMVEVFREVRRVLRDDGTLWLNVGDSYAAAKTGSFNGGGFKDTSAVNGTRDLSGVKTSGDFDKAKACASIGVKPKDLVGIPWMLAFALRSDGWYLRQDIIWHKPNPMPESVTDRCTKTHEYIFLMAKAERYYYDSEAVKEVSVDPEGSANRYAAPFFVGKKHESGGYSANGQLHTAGMKKFNGTRNRRSVWTVATQPYNGAHFATFPQKLIEPCIRAGCPDGGVVLDPFAGSGTTLYVARDQGCKSIGIELNRDYCELVKRRLQQRVLI